MLPLSLAIYFCIGAWFIYSVVYWFSPIGCNISFWKTFVSLLFWPIPMSVFFYKYFKKIIESEKI